MTLRLAGTVVICVMLSLSSQFPAHADDQNDAIDASDEILTVISQKQFEKLWDSHVAEVYKSTQTKNSFLANMSIGMQQAGELNEWELVDVAYFKEDPSSGLTGEIYSVHYLTTFGAGKFYQRIVVLKEDDGEFRLAGLWSAPAEN